MNKTLLLTFILACVQASVLAQSTESKTETRQVKGQVLTSPQLPVIEIKFEDSFKHVGSQKYVLEGVAQVEQFFFVDADSERLIKRLYIVQFEGALPGVAGAYSLPTSETITLAGQTYVVRAETVPNLAAALKPNPTSNAARAVSFLETKGYRLNQSIRFQRFMRLVDDAKRNQFFLNYIEDAADSATPPEVLARALKGFTIKGEAMSNDSSPKSKPRRDIDTLIKDFADHNRPSDYSELISILPTARLFLHLLAPLPAGIRPGEPIKIPEGMELKAGTTSLQNREYVVLFTSATHPRLGANYAEIEGLEALKMLLKTKLDGLLLQGPGLEWVILTRKTAEDLLSERPD